MSGQFFAIEARERRNAGYLSSLHDFTLGPSEPVATDIIRTSPNLHLYCHDDATKRAIFVELPPEIDLSKAPFVYQTLYENAQRLLAVPYPEFNRVARDLPPVTHLIMTYMTGRCGSTLLSHALNELDDVYSLSEPDVATQFIHLRRLDGHSETELRELLDSSVRALFKPTAFKQASTFALKLRSEGTQAMDLYQATFPHAKNIFLYRDAIGWVRSFYRLFRNSSDGRTMPLDEILAIYHEQKAFDFSQIAKLLDSGTTEVTVIQVLTMWWLAAIEWYEAKYIAGIPILAARYADLLADRETILRELFAYCGLPAERVPETFGAFERDSQAGTSLARENPREGNKLRLTEAQRAEITTLLSRHAHIKSSDYVVPGTIALTQ